jgi:hypothetical protein
MSEWRKLNALMAKSLAMAQSWISLADLAERNSHLDRIDEPLPRRESHIH